MSALRIFRTLYLPIKWVVILFAYYFLVFLLGLAVTLFTLLTETQQGSTNIFSLAVFGSMGMSATGGAMYYLRKLYKTCFLSITSPKVDGDKSLREIGTIIYFIARPLFSIGFSFLVIVSLRAGFTFTSQSPIELSEGFIYISMFLSFYVGFFSGRFINTLERQSNDMLSKIIGDLEKSDG